MYHVGERRGAYRILLEKREGKKQLGRPSVGGRVMLRWHLGLRLDSSGSLYVQVAGFCETFISRRPPSIAEELLASQEGL
jgi:hypothetical protein